MKKIIIEMICSESPEKIAAKVDRYTIESIPVVREGKAVAREIRVGSDGIEPQPYSGVRVDLGKKLITPDDNMFVKFYFTPGAEPDTLITIFEAIRVFEYKRSLHIRSRLEQGLIDFEEVNV